MPLSLLPIRSALQPLIAAVLLLTIAPACGIAGESAARSATPPGSLQGPPWGVPEEQAAAGRQTALDGTQQELDQIDRKLSTPAQRKLACPEVTLVDYRGTHGKYGGAVRVHPSFQKRLELFEAVTNQVAERVYGRAPKKIRHAGAFRCRAGTGYWSSSRLSEHALGNALDVYGFDFAAAPKKDGASLPKAIRGAFSVTVARSWDDPAAGAGLHARFLRELITELRSQQVFRGLIGPSDPRHRDHFHLDGGPWTYSRI